MNKEWKELPHKERKRKRLEQSIPVLNAFFAWAENVNTHQEPLKKAIRYTLNHRESFTKLSVGWAYSISNNMSENSIRAVALARKNFLFSDTPQGAEASALVSIIETAKANGLDPYEYLVYIFRNLLNLDFYNKPESFRRLHALGGFVAGILLCEETNKEAEEGK
ncbi:IS66 family transposase [Desulfosporosinus youngiae]|uniref:IS66 family transposase n=1 Tax=Desulfosporosinus youngiae TaxID=339862 RepID=UPI0005A7CA4E|nr:transposase [Desulfosporosinus youngiae]